MTATVIDTGVKSCDWCFRGYRPTDKHVDSHQRGDGLILNGFCSASCETRWMHAEQVEAQRIDDEHSDD